MYKQTAYTHSQKYWNSASVSGQSYLETISLIHSQVGGLLIKNVLSKNSYLNQVFITGFCENTALYNRSSSFLGELPLIVAFNVFPTKWASYSFFPSHLRTADIFLWEEKNISPIFYIYLSKDSSIVERTVVHPGKAAASEYFSQKSNGPSRTSTNCSFMGKASDPQEFIDPRLSVCELLQKLRHVCMWHTYAYMHTHTINIFIREVEGLAHSFRLVMNLLIHCNKETLISSHQLSNTKSITPCNSTTFLAL